MIRAGDQTNGNPGFFTEFLLIVFNPFGYCIDFGDGVLAGIHNMDSGHVEIGFAQ